MILGVFIINSILLGVGLAMDAFSVSVANGIIDTRMKSSRICFIAGTFAAFQFAMPMIGWVCVHTVVQYFKAFEKFIPWIALILLAYIGGNMIIGAIKNSDGDEEREPISGAALFVAGIATSIDALSVGFTIASYNLTLAFFSSLIIAVVTFIICATGIVIGKKCGDIFGNKAEIFGGCILLFIGIEIFVTGIM